ncbi:hypothetical protein A9Z39_25640 [Paenibacillus polymyxa]|nr:hypothetical protein A9Z39_25640 [Paenibacillus polymyxa]
MHYNNEDMLINYDFYGLHELDSDNFLTNYDTAQLHNKSKSFESFPVGEIRANALNQRLDRCNRLFRIMHLDGQVRFMVEQTVRNSNLDGNSII